MTQDNTRAYFTIDELNAWADEKLRQASAARQALINTGIGRMTGYESKRQAGTGQDACSRRCAFNPRTKKLQTA
jgi:hypothetical protein